MTAQAGDDIQRDRETASASGNRMRRHPQSVAQSANIAPAPLHDHPIVQMAQQGRQTLQSTARGPEFDRAYVGDQVRMHRQVLETARQAQQQASSAAVKQHLQPVIQEHLREAEELQRTLGGQ